MSRLSRRHLYFKDFAEAASRGEVDHTLMMKYHPESLASKSELTSINELYISLYKEVNKGMLLDWYMITVIEYINECSLL